MRSLTSIVAVSLPISSSISLFRFDMLNSETRTTRGTLNEFHSSSYMSFENYTEQLGFVNKIISRLSEYVTRDYSDRLNSPIEVCLWRQTLMLIWQINMLKT